MWFNQRVNISTLQSVPLKLVDNFAYLRSCVSSTEKYINSQLAQAWTTIDMLLVIWKSDLIDKIKHTFFQVAVASILLYGCTTWTLTKRMEKKLDDYYTRMLQAILKKSGGSTSQNSSCTATCHPLRKLSKLDKTDIQDIAGEERTNS